MEFPVTKETIVFVKSGKVTKVEAEAKQVGKTKYYMVDKKKAVKGGIACDEVGNVIFRIGEKDWYQLYA